MRGREVAGVLLAGGLARRMGGGDKCLLELGGHSLLARAIERLRPQVTALVLNANGETSRFAPFGLPVIRDPIEGFAGPLAGILAGLEWAATVDPPPRWLVSVPTDTPFFPRDLVDRMLEAVERDGGDLACAASDGRDHPVFGLWPVAIREALEQALRVRGERKIDRFTAGYRLARAVFPAEPFDPFFNVNRPEDLARAEALAAAGEG